MNQSTFSPYSCPHSTMRHTAADKGSVIKRLLAQILPTLGSKLPAGAGYHSTAAQGWEQHPAGTGARGGGRHSPLPPVGLGRPEGAWTVICSSPDREGKANVESPKLSPGLPSGQEGTGSPGMHRGSAARACTTGQMP